MLRRKKLSRGAAIVGGGLTKLGLFKDRNCKDFFAEAFMEMVESVDKGLDPKEIDAIYVGNYSNDFFVNQSHWGPIISDLLGHVPKPVTRTEAACASSAVAFREGVFAIASGLYDIVLVGGFEQMSLRSTEEVAEGLAMASSPYEVAAGFTFPGVFGTMATAYFAKYGADREALFNVTIKSHNNAPLNPKAQFPMSIRDFMNARIERCRKKKGSPCRSGKMKRTFFAIRRSILPLHGPCTSLTVVPSATGLPACFWWQRKLPKTSPIIRFTWLAWDREAATVFMPKKT